MNNHPAGKTIITFPLQLALAAALMAAGSAAKAGVVFTNLYPFSDGPGNTPEAGLVQGVDGYFYGTTYYGGSNNAGTVFKISASGQFTSLYSFTGGNDGGDPAAGLTPGSNNYFYGTTYFGGTNDAGVIFKMSTNGVVTPLYSFIGNNDGSYPEAGLALGSDGYFYGACSTGGSNGAGSVFKISPGGSFKPLYSFLGSYDGGGPMAGLVLGKDGQMYGTTLGDGTNGWGAVFKINTNGLLTPLYSFKDSSDGARPAAGLALGSDGNFYGTTTVGGASNYGTIFKISAAGTVTPMYSFTDRNDGSHPQAPLVQGSDGNFYGTSYGDSFSENFGAVFEITTNKTFTPLYSFTGGNDGAFPQAPLAQGADGNFYGTTLQGGVGNVGGVFRISLGLAPAIAIVTTNPEFGFTNGVFGFDISGPTSANVVVQGSADLATWTSLQTNLIGTGLFYFSDPQSVTNQQRFYRLTLP